MNEAQRQRLLELRAQHRQREAMRGFMRLIDASDNGLVFLSWAQDIDGVVPEDIFRPAFAVSAVPEARLTDLTPSALLPWLHEVLTPACATGQVALAGIVSGSLPWAQVELRLGVESLLALWERGGIHEATLYAPTLRAGFVVTSEEYSWDLYVVRP